MNITKKSPDGSGRMEKGVVEWPLAPTAPGPDGATHLEAVCRSVAELARSSSRPPSRIKLCHGSTTVEMEWPDPVPVASAAVPSAVLPARSCDPGPVSATEAGREDKTDDGLSYICAPMVGTFYRADEPGAAPLVSVGDLVQPGQAVGIFEVMKMLSTVHADVAGRVVDILVADGQPVEYAQQLMAVEPVSRGEDC